MKMANLNTNITHTTKIITARNKMEGCFFHRALFLVFGDVDWSTNGWKGWVDLSCLIIYKKSSKECGKTGIKNKTIKFGRRLIFQEDYDQVRLWMSLGTKVCVCVRVCGVDRMFFQSKKVFVF